jgi:hypothetical protein
VTRDWDAEIDRWTERFRDVADAPEPFATALRDGWTDEARASLRADAQAEAERQEAYVAQIAGAGVDLVRFDAKQGHCGVCVKYVGKAFSLTGEVEGLPPPPPLPICPACRHTLNLLTPFFMQSLDLDLDDLVADAQPFVDD